MGNNRIIIREKSIKRNFIDLVLFSRSQCPIPILVAAKVFLLLLLFIIYLFIAI